MDAWGGGEEEGAEPFVAVDASLDRCAIMLDLIEQVRAARELRQQLGIGPASSLELRGWAPAGAGPGSSPRL